MVPLSDRIGRLVTDQRAILEERIAQANSPGNLEGLLAHHILRQRRVGFDWNVSPMAADWLADNEHRFRHAHGIAVLGFGLAAFHTTESSVARRHLNGHLPDLMRRSPFQSDGATFINDPGQIVGLALAVNAVQTDDSRAHEWLTGVLQDPRLRPATPFLGLFQAYARHLLGAPPGLSAELTQSDDPGDLAAMHWVAASVRDLPNWGFDAMRGLQAKVMNAVLLGTDAATSVT